MKPAKLIIQAMGPYRGEESIDFTVLGDKKFFLIHGPTGSGKTSILDAITYSLYGSTSGDERSLEQMRSQWADADTESYVQFDFYIGGKLYRVKRRPGQVLNKKRGTGTRSVDAEATLWFISGEPEVLATGIIKVTTRVESLLGFSSEQFRQVIVLPQGKFRELLSAKAEGREEILKVLFNTEKYTLIQNMIKERASAVRQRLESLRFERETVLKGEGVQGINELKILFDERNAEAENLKTVLKKLRADGKKIDAEYQKASLIEARFLERDSALEALRLLEAEKPEIERYENIISICRRAISLKDFHKSFIDERERYSLIEKKFYAARDEEAGSGKRRASLEEALHTIPEKESRQKILEQEIFRLESVSGSYAELEKIGKDIEIFSDKKEDSQKLYNSLILRKDELQGAIKIFQKQIGEAEIAGASIPALQSSLEKIISAGKIIAEIEKNRISLSELEKFITGLEKCKASALEKLNESANARIVMEDQWIKGQAALIARELDEGKPCPVCGSLHHPAAATGEGDIPSMKDIEKARKLEKESDEKFRNIEKDLIKKNTEFESLKNLNVTKDDIPEEFRNMRRDELEEIYRKEFSTLNSIKEVYSSVDSQKDKLAESENILKQVIAGFETTAEEMKNYEITLASIKSRSDQIKKNLPEDISDIQSLGKKIDELKKEAMNIAVYITETEKAYHGASESYIASKTLLERSEKDYNEAEDRLKNKSLEFKVRLSEEKFSSEEEFVEALRISGSVIEIEERVEKYRSQLVSAKDRAGRASAGLEKLERPDLRNLSEKISELNGEIEKTLGGLNLIESFCERVLRIIQRINELELSLENEEKKYGIIQTLSETAGGRNKFRLTFQRYVLQSFFDDVLMIASNRLERMSRGRYRLISTGRVEDRRGIGGLDLEVFDEYTGYSRPVVTLSGGEAFLASLSLALGLADLVQQYSGGIFLDTVFIDEGFGSLDSETLDLAINTLVDLQNSGRLVGIISHVNELKERIDARLEVIPVAYGSTTKFVV